MADPARAGQGLSDGERVNGVQLLPIQRRSCEWIRNWLQFVKPHSRAFRVSVRVFFFEARSLPVAAISSVRSHGNHLRLRRVVRARGRKQHHELGLHADQRFLQSAAVVLSPRVFQDRRHDSGGRSQLWLPSRAEEVFDNSRYKGHKGARDYGKHDCGRVASCIGRCAQESPRCVGEDRRQSRHFRIRSGWFRGFVGCCRAYQRG